MKRCALGIFLVAIMFFLSGCDNTAPIITGEDSIEISVDSTITDWTQYVSALDDRSGEITITTDMIDITDVDLAAVGTYEVHYTVTDDNGNEGQYTLTVVVVDDVNPSITLNGDDVVYVEYGESYAELGATCLDNYDATCTVTIAGDTVESMILGSYEITYNAMDSENNAATEVTRTVVVQDTTAPVITLNGDDVVYVEYGELYEELSATCLDNYDATCTVSIAGDTVESSILGSYEITYNAMDSENNAAIEVTRTVVVQDTTAPVITLNGDDVVYVEYGETYDELGATCLDNYDATCTVSIAGDTVESTILGSYEITYNAMDSEDNTAIEVTRTVVVQDTTAPVITLNGDDVIYSILGELFTDPGAEVFDAYDQDVTLTVYGSVDIDTVGEYFITYYSIDSEGNEASVQRQVIIYEDISDEIYESTDLSIEPFVSTGNSVSFNIRNDGELYSEATIHIRVIGEDDTVYFTTVYSNYIGGNPMYTANNLPSESTYTIEITMSYETIIDVYNWTLDTVDLETTSEFNVYDFDSYVCSAGGFAASCHVNWEGEITFDANESFTFRLYDENGYVDEFTPYVIENVEIFVDIMNLDFLSSYTVELVYHNVDGDTTESTVIAKMYFTTIMPNYIDALIENRNGLIISNILDTSVNFNMFVYSNYGFVVDENNFLDYTLYDGDTVVETGRLDTFGWSPFVLEGLTPETEYLLVLRQHFVQGEEPFVDVRREYRFTTLPTSSVTINLNHTITQTGIDVNLTFINELNLDITEVDVDVAFNPLFPETIVYETTLVDDYSFTVMGFTNNIMYVRVIVTFTENDVSVTHTQIFEIFL
ncbi:DUF5011 domain-containing protein [Candidatus Xianfuyuplasma coldseepsis]|uniref:DUF5011 domain-containing protein n=1 Tax=Candidatus Xianfuyuplasma coldseepsis TaxID=2782163 RepID=A0A7L7KRR2_9MOLU|nr:DUF5011 domain-containing protein [Xianfuyuplasma coldseepsis]QMS85285.1 DUF5011 domain-containing protein [Xianfuyuplasma coldseepsis]